MTKVDWSYHRNSCKTCAKAQDFLSRHKIATAATVDARKERMGDAEALALLEGVDELVVAKGKKVVKFSLKKERPDDEVLLAHLIGPTGNLRAPTMRRGKKLVVGFDETMYEEFFGVS